MRDFYQALGLRGIVADLLTIERVLGRDRVAPDIHEDACFVLLDPTRKARYDWALGRTMELSAARSRLGLLEDPRLPGRQDARRPQWASPVIVPAMIRRPTRIGWGGVAILLAALFLWAGYHSNRKLREAHVEGATVLQEPHEDMHRLPGDIAAAIPKEESTSAPPPEHGWLQLGSETHLVVPWHIETDPGQDYVLTLLDVKSQTLVLTLYLRGGEPYQGLAPEGSFELSYSTGTRWFGFQHGFGAKAKVIQPALTYRIETGTDGEGIWKLRLNPSSCEGIPTVSTASADNPVPAPPDRSL